MTPRALGTVVWAAVVAGVREGWALDHSALLVGRLLPRALVNDELVGDFLTIRQVGHPDVLSWLRAGREGVAVVDPVRAAPLLHDGGTVEVGSHAERRRLADMLTVRLPDIRVRPTVRSAAA